MSPFSHSFKAAPMLLWTLGIIKADVYDQVRPSNRVDCPCGRSVMFLAPTCRADKVHVCECGAWHSIQWTGERGYRETLEDVKIEMQLRQEAAC